MNIQPCPFCGGEARLFPVEQVGNWAFVDCLGCNATGPMRADVNQAVADWNKTSRAARLLAAVEGLAATRHTFTAGEHMGSGLVILQDMGGTIHGEGRGPTLADALIALWEKSNA